MSQKHVKVVVSGAAGNIGYALIFRIASGQVFGPDVTVDLHLLEIEPALPALTGVMMELQDCAFPLLRNIVTTSDLKVAFKDVNWAILVGAIPRKAGMERSDLLQVNGGIFVPQGRAINDYAASDVRVFVVGNPCNTNCLIAMHSAPDVPRDRFFAMITLDENRARSQLAIKAGVSVTDVKNMIVWGNHSSTQYPDFYNATVKGQPAIQVVDEQWLQKEYVPMVQQRGAAVIKARGASSAASAANAAINGVQHLVNPTPFNDVYSMSLCSQGQYGVDEGLIFGFPCRTDAQGKLQVIETFKHGNEFAKEQFAKTLDELRAERDAVKQLKLIN